MRRALTHALPSNKQRGTSGQFGSTMGENILRQIHSGLRVQMLEGEKRRYGRNWSALRITGYALLV
jgi:hypothetical protein